MTEKERELFLSAIVALLLLTAIVLLVAPNHGMAAPAAVDGKAETELPAVELIVLTPSPSPEPTPAPTAEPQDYILNNNTKRFHYPDCKSVLDIYPQNMEPVTASRDELIARGYVPCGNCKP